MRRFLAPLAFLAFATACGSTVLGVGSRTTGAASGRSDGGGAGGAGGTGAGGGFIGFGGAPVVDAGSFACKEANGAYFVDVSGDGPMKQLANGCTEPMAWGHYTETPGGGGGLEIFGCLAGSPVRIELNAGIMAPGTDNTVIGGYTDANGVSWQSLTFGTMTLTSYGPPGDAIDGAFVIAVASTTPDGGAGPSLSGSFHLCHRPDLIAP